MQPRWQAWLDLITPWSGRIRAEDGEYINIASLEQVRDQYSLISRTAAGGAAILSRTVSITTEYYYFALSVPAGREFVLFDRSLTLGAGAYEVDVASFPDGYTGGVAAYNAPLNATESSDVQSTLWCGATPVNAGVFTIRDQDYVDTGEQHGSGRVNAGASKDGGLRIYPAGSLTMLRIRRLQAVDYTANIRIFCWEHDAA